MFGSCCKKRGANPLWGILGIAVMVLGAQAWTSRDAPTPPSFAEGVPLDNAIELADGADRVVFAVATADWCPPCKTYKRGALSDDRVTAWLGANAVPILIDVDEFPDDASRLGVSSIPATFILRDGEVVARSEGAWSAGALLDWLDAYAVTTPD